MKYYSQSAQDKFADKYVLNKLEGGFFLEVGAYDGISFSNTYTFEKFRNWQGICIEPIPKIYDKLKANRKCECIHGCIYSYDGEIEISHVDGPSEMLTGITAHHNELHKERINKEIKQLGGEINTHKVKSYNLTNLLLARGKTHVNFCSIDVEGSEIEVLSSIDFSQITFDVLAIENNYDDNTILAILENNNYECIGKLGADQIFVSSNRNDISKLKIACKFENLKNKVLGLFK